MRFSSPTRRSVPGLSQAFPSKACRAMSSISSANVTSRYSAKAFKTFKSLRSSRRPVWMRSGGAMLSWYQDTCVRRTDPACGAARASVVVVVEGKERRDVQGSKRHGDGSRHEALDRVLRDA